MACLLTVSTRRFSGAGGGGGMVVREHEALANARLKSCPQTTAQGPCSSHSSAGQDSRPPPESCSVVYGPSATSGNLPPTEQRR